jgi:hypothetical protein
MNDSLETIDFSEVLKALKDTSTPFHARYLRSFSDLSRRHLKDLMNIWEDLPENRKVNLLEDLEDVMESDTLVCYDNLARELLNDPHPSIRVLALRLLWECEEEHLIPHLLELSVNDANVETRATSTSLLGKYVLMGELESLKPDAGRKVVDHLISIAKGNDQIMVKRRALESLGYSSHPEVPGLIQNAYLSTDNDWIISALCAMGRSADEEWASQVDKMLTSTVPEIQFEAIRAAGELELSTSRDKLLSLLDEGMDDDEIRLALIWSLSQIGGDDVKERLHTLLAEAVTDEEADWIEKAIENMELTSPGGIGAFGMDMESSEDQENDDEDYLDDEPYDYDDESDIDDEEDFEDEEY